VQKINLPKLTSLKIDYLAHMRYFLIKENVRLMIKQAQHKIILTLDFKTKIFSIIFHQEEEENKIWMAFKIFSQIFLEEDLEVKKVIEVKITF
jgi:hypothetical protein